MAVTTLTSRELNQDVGRAKRAARQGPVFITDRGRPSHVLLTIEEYHRLTGTTESIVEQLAMPGTGEDAFEPARAGELYRPAGLD